MAAENKCCTDIMKKTLQQRTCVTQGSGYV